MEYEIMINLLDNTSSQPSKLRTKNCVEINDIVMHKYLLKKP